MKSIVELLNELNPLSPFAFAQRVGVDDFSVASGQQLDFDNWLRRCVKPERRFSDLGNAYSEYLKSFG